MVTSQKMFSVIFVAVVGVLILTSGTALAVSSYVNSFNTKYGTSGTALGSCSLCHTSVPDLNGYGDDYSGSYNFADIEGLDSDGDGFVNLDEINARTFPGNASSFPATLPSCTDSDGDGFAVEGGDCGVVDCNDSISAVNPSAQESCIDSIDNNCNGLIDNQDPQAVNCPPVCTDLDGDGYAIEGGNCGQVDCNDNAPLVNPGAAENCSDNLDNDCDSLVDEMDPNAVNCSVTPPSTPNCTDNDTDGFAVEGGECGLVDCDDTDPAIHPEAIELCTDSVDNDCDGLINFADPNAIGCPVGCTDLDLDGYAIDGGDCGPVDCNDQDEFINPLAAEFGQECSDSIDNDCDDLVDAADPSCSEVLSAPTISLNVSGVNLSINWSSVADATGYKLSYAPYPYTGTQSIVSIDLGNKTSFSYALWKGASYYVTVQAYNAEGSSSYSNIEYFTIGSTDDDADDDGDDDGDDDTAPATPSISVTVTGLNVSISWPAVADAAGYTLSYAPNPYVGPQSVNSADLGNKTSVSYELWAGASYKVAIQAYNDHGNSDYSNIEDFVIESSVEVPGHVDGAQLYATNCASCHGSLNASNVAGEDADDIKEAIEDNEGGMGFLSFLNQNELNAVTEVLASYTPPAATRTGQKVYDDSCAGCHLVNGYDAAGNIDLASKGDTASTKLASGHGGGVNADEIVNVAAWLDTWAPVSPPDVARTGQKVYDDNCAGCHLVNGYDAEGNIDLAGMGSTATTKLASGHGGTLIDGESANISTWLDTWAPVPPPTDARTGQKVYDDNCAGCHLVNGYDAAGNIDLAGMGSTANTKLASGHGGTLIDGESANVSTWLNTWAPVPPPAVARTGQKVYDDNCAGCHLVNGYDAAGNIDLAGMGSTANTKLASGHGGTLIDGESANVSTWLNTWAPVPPPAVARTGQKVYDDNCAGCHLVNGYDAAGNIDLAGMGSTANTKLASGHGGTLIDGESANVSTWLNTWAPVPPPAVARTGQKVYDDNCAGCHLVNGYDAAGNIDLAGMGSTASTKLASGHGGTLIDGESANVSTWLNTWAPVPPPAVARTGQKVYDDNCAGCHLVNGYDAAGNIDLAGMGSTASTKLASGHGGTLIDGESANVSTWLNTWAPVPPPAVARTGQKVYDDNCAGCHLVNGYDAAGNIDLAGMGSTATTKLASGHGGTLIDGESANVSTWLNTWAPVPPPAVARTGQKVYDDNCAGCHLVNGYDAAGNIDLAGMGSTATTKLASGHGGTLIDGESANVSTWLDTFTPGEPGPGSCTSCHAQPPSGSSSPNRAGAHGVHTALNGLADNCATCHSSGASHNGTVDLGLSSSWNAKSGSAVANSNGTCSTVSCHGGATTPNWQSGSINVDSQCTSCHSSGTAQYNGYFSGKHRKHVSSERIACTTCHDVNLLRNGHFTNLATKAFEQNPAASIKNSLSYAGGRCSTVSCHGGEKWLD